jgi:molybdenum cofactor sulfurtransferase
MSCDQVQLPSMCSIQTSIDLSTGMMQVWAPNMNHCLAIPLQGDQCSGTSDLILCGNRAGGNSYGPEVAEWFTEALGIPCSLLRREPKSRKLQSRRRTRGVGKRDDDNDGGSTVASELSFVNEGQLLLVSKASIDELNQRMAVCVCDCLGEKNSKFSFSGTKRRFRI